MRRRLRSIPILSLLVALCLVSPCRAGQLPSKLPGQSATLLPDGRLLLIGGAGPQGPLSTVAILNTQSSAVRRLPTGIHQARAWHTATVLPNGTVLVFGGIGVNGQGVDAEIFDPSTDTSRTFQTAGVDPRAYHTATLLTDGRVLISGGRSRTGQVLDSIALWDYRSHSATEQAAAMFVAREKHTASLLPDGSVLLWGGIDASGMELDFGERFDPVSERTTLQRGPAMTEPPEWPLQLEASLPPDQSSDVPADAVVALRFSMPLNVVTANARTVTLAGPEGPLPARVVPAESGMLVFVSPQADLLPATAYTVSMSGLSSGGSLLPDTSISFNTAGSPLGVAEPGIGATGGLEDNASEISSAWSSLPSFHAAAGVTAVTGRVLRLNGHPLANVTLTISGTATTSDQTGRFLLSQVPHGHRVMLIDGGTASNSAATYGVFEVGIEVAKGRTSTLPYTIWMPALDTAHVVTIPSPTKTETVISSPRLPGLELHLPSSTVVYDHNWKVVTHVGITPIPLDRPPFPLPRGVEVPIYFSIQPGAGYIEVQDPKQPQGGWLVYPNTYHSAPGTAYDFWNYDPGQKGWYIYGHGKVTPNGAQIAPDPGVLIYQLTGAMVAAPSLAPATGPAPGSCGGTDGDPVDCGTGLFVWQKTDLFLPDIIPITLTRTYRPNDSVSRAFGIGTTQFYDMFLVGDTNPFTFADLILPDGGRVHYKRISAGTGFADAVYQHTSSPTIFYGSTITFDVEQEIAGALTWDLRLKDGTVFVFGAAATAIPGQVALLEIRDRYGNVLRLNRDSSFNLTTITTPNGRSAQLTYDTSNRIIQAQDNAGRTVTYTYDSGGRLSTVTDPNGGVTTYTYDTDNRMLSIQNARGIVQVTNQYDSKGRVVHQTQANGGTFHFNYIVDAGGNIIETDVTNPLGIVRKITFNSSGYVLTDTRASGRPERQTITSQRQAKTNLLLGVIDALGRRTAFAYDAFANVTSVTRLAGTLKAVTTTFTYEPQFNQVTSVTDPLKHTTTLAYDETGNLTSVADPLSHRWKFVHNGAGQPIASTDPLGNTTRFNYAAGDLVSVTDPLGHTSTRVIDGAGRLIAASDPLGNTTQYFYDSLNRLIQVLDPLQGVTNLSYDPDGNLLSLTDPRKHVTHYTYDSMDQLMSRADPLSRKETYQHDLFMNLTRFTDRRGLTTQFGYDGLNRKISASFGAESTITYRYDQGNRLTEALDSLAGAINRTYDDLDGLTSESTPQGTVTYTRNALDQRTSMTVFGQAAITYAYDAANRPTQISQGGATVGFTYDAANRRATLALPNGVAGTYTFDQASHLTSLTYTHGSTTVGDLTYTYDEAGRRTSAGGNLSNHELPLAIGSASYDAANELTQMDTVKLAYDLDGNLTGDGVNRYTWNARNQLAQVSAGGTPFATFQYDGFGRRFSKAASGLTTQFLYDGPNAVQEIAGTTANLLTGLSVDEIFTRTDPAGSRSLVTDALGSTLALTDASGNVQTQYAYAPFGNTTVSGSPSTNSFQYTGRENDGTGLYYYRARYYSAALSRFIGEDPLRFTGGDINLYAYNRNNPITLTDPFGTISLVPPGWFANPENVALAIKAAEAAAGVDPVAAAGIDPLAATAVDPLAATAPGVAADVSPFAFEVAAPEAIAGTTSGLGSNITALGLNFSQFAPQVEAASAAQAAAAGEGAAGGIGLGTAFAGGLAVGTALAIEILAAHYFHAAACTLQ
jgi:RHS repeat-associated protein